jgi:NAD(P)-dependent dehydrogenase (short-subunit alcohol dehydrogenase family)
MMAQQTEKIALVTGANRGIGREITRQLALRGFRLHPRGSGLLDVALDDGAGIAEISCHVSGARE